MSEPKTCPKCGDKPIYGPIAHVGPGPCPGNYGCGYPCHTSANNWQLYNSVEEAVEDWNKFVEGYLGEDAEA